MHTQSKTKLLVAPVGLDRAEEELRAVGVGAGVGHREGAHALVVELEVLVLEAAAICVVVIEEVGMSVWALTR